MAEEINTLVNTISMHSTREYGMLATIPEEILTADF